MDFRNVLMAIVLSTIVLIGWATFFEAPIVEQQTTEKEITKNEDLSSPSIDEDKKEIKNEITRNDVINNTKRIKVENKNINDSIAFANATAGLSTTKVGTASSMPLRSEIDNLL